MRNLPTTVRVAAGAAGLVLVTACGGGGHPDEGRQLAAQACQTNGATAASLAAQAAAKNGKYSTLAADEQAAATAGAQQQGVLSDGNAGDDVSTESLIGAQTTGTAAGQRVLADCTDLGLSVLPGR